MELKKDTYSKEEVSSFIAEKDNKKYVQVYNVRKAMNRLITLYGTTNLDLLKQKIRNYLEEEFADVPRPKSRLSTQPSD